MLDTLLIYVFPVTVLFGFGLANAYEEKTVYTQAIVNIINIKTGKKFTVSSAEYVNGDNDVLQPVNGKLYFAGADIDWCDPLPSSKVSQMPHQNQQWIALIPSGSNCTCRTKLDTAKKHNASAALIYPHPLNTKDCEETIIDTTALVTVKISDKDARKLLKVYTYENIECSITKGKKFVEKQFKVSRTSVLFVLVSFILLMCISLAWLVFYYVQRFRHIYRNDRKEKQLLSAAKKAISKLKTISFQSGNKDGEDDSCAVCLENYKDGENIRVLPCKHLFHKACIDPWLLNHRTCPMCKSNILKSLGVEIPDNIDLSQYDLESRRISREVETVQSSPAPTLPNPPEEEVLPDVSDVPSTSVFGTGGSSSQAWPTEPHVVSASCCSSTSSMLSDTDSERSTVALVSVVQKV